MATLFNFGFTIETGGGIQNESSSSDSDIEDDLPEHPPRKKPKRQFQKKWCDQWPWVRYDEANEVMYCFICRQVNLQVCVCVCTVTVCILCSCVV